MSNHFRLRDIQTNEITQVKADCDPNQAIVPDGFLLEFLRDGTWHVYCKPTERELVIAGILARIEDIEAELDAMTQELERL